MWLWVDVAVPILTLVMWAATLFFLATSIATLAAAIIQAAEALRDHALAHRIENHLDRKQKVYPDFNEYLQSLASDRASRQDRPNGPQ